MLRLSILTVGLMVLAGFMVGTNDPGDPAGAVNATAVQPVEVESAPVSTARAGSTFLMRVGFGGATSRALPQSDVSEAEAIRIAVERGADLRASRVEDASALRGISEIVRRPPPSSAKAEAGWVVTGSRVNLRAGPGTTHGVVGVAGEGDRMEPLTDTTKSWIQVRLSSGGTAWIFAKFLREARG